VTNVWARMRPRADFGGLVLEHAGQADCAERPDIFFELWDMVEAALGLGEILVLRSTNPAKPEPNR
jgi:hypothetical protein